jgi:pimeloyl-ACP methyl ester carboxylesterase
VDTVYPPLMRVVRIPSNGVRLNGVLYLAQGRGSHRTVVLLLGFPGDEKNLDLAPAVRRAGLNALVFYYRGAWGSPGTYSYSHVLEDVSAVLAWLHESTTADSMRVDSGHVILGGHSLGGFAALYTAATNNQIEEVAAIAPIDLGSRGTAMRDSIAFAEGVQRRGAQLSALRGTSGEELSREAVTHADHWSLQQYAGVLAKKKILLLAATHDGAVALSEVFAPLGTKLRAAGARKLTMMTLPSDHLFSSMRIGLAQVLLTWLCESS